jgi:hypothetical protein
MSFLNNSPVCFCSVAAGMVEPATAIAAITAIAATL